MWFQKQNLRNYFLIFFVPVWLLVSPRTVSAQTVASDLLKQGIEYFYVARFDEAVLTLRQAIKAGGLNKTELFDAYVHIGFSLIRSNGQGMLIDQAFAQAIKIDATRNLSSAKVPPDLIQRFDEVRNKIVGGLVVIVRPPEASVLLLQPDYNIELVGIAPANFNDLLIGEYNLLISKSKYQTALKTTMLKPGKVDTLYVILNEKPKPFYRQWWAWGSGLAIASAAVTYFALSGQETEPPEGPKELPPPVIHPKP